MDEESLRTKIEEQVAYEEKAFRQVEKLVLAERVSKEDLEIAVNQILPGHYADIAEERSISKACGYPLCSNKIAKIPKQNFHISLKHKRVYDIKERKCYCSNLCFKASKYIESQIPADPLWMRKDKFVKVEFLEDSPSNKPSNDASMEACNIECTNLEKDDESDIKKVSDDTDLLSPKNDIPCLLSKSDNDRTFAKDYTSSRSSCLIEPKNMKSQASKTVDIDRLCSWLEEWCTVDTFKFFEVKKEEKETSLQMSHDQREKQNSNQEPKSCQNDRSIFMRKFLGENSEWSSETRMDRNTKKPEYPKAFISPPVDSRSQQTIRRRIVSQKLRNGFSEVFSDLSLSSADLPVDLAALVKTFRFTNQNISLKAKEWKLLAAALLQRLALENTTTAALLDRRKTETLEVLNSCSVNEEQFTKLSKVLERNIDRLEQININPLSNEVIDYDNDSLD